MREICNDMHILFYMASIVAKVRWIIHFKNEGQLSSIIVTDNLRSLNISMFDDISNEGIEKYKFACNVKKYDVVNDPWNILHPDKNDISQNLSIENHTTNIKDEEEYSYKEIYLPISKETFCKTVSLSPNSETVFTANEVFEILKYLVAFLDNKLCISYAIYQNIQRDLSIFDQLMTICDNKSKTTKCGDIDNGKIVLDMFMCLMTELADHHVLIIEDNYGNTAVASVDNKRKNRMHIPVSIERMGWPFPIKYITASTGFLIENDRFLHDLYSNVSMCYDLVLTIDFSDIINMANKTSLEKMIRKELVKLSDCTFIMLNIVRMICIHFEFINCNFDLRFISNKNTGFEFHGCILSDGIQFPLNTCEITLINCCLNTNTLIFNDLKSIIIKNTKILEDMSLSIKDAEYIELIDICGNVDMMHSEQKFGISQFNENWSFKQKKKDGRLDELLISNAVLFNSKITFNNEIQKLVFKNIDLEDKSIIVVGRNVKNAYFEEFSGVIHLHGILMHDKPLAICLLNGVLSIERLGSENYKMFTLVNAKILDYISLPDIFQKIHFTRTILPDYDTLSRLNNRLDEIVLVDCEGSVPLNISIGVGRLLFGTHINGEQMFLYRKKVGNSKSKLIMKNFVMHDNVTITCEIDELTLNELCVLNENGLCISGKFKKICLYECAGQYSIPGILHEGQNIIKIMKDLDLEINAVKEDIYNIYISNMVVKGLWCFNFDIDRLKLCNIVSSNKQSSLNFNNSCRSLILNQFDCNISLQNVKAFNKVIVQNNTDPRALTTIFSIPTVHIELSNITITSDIILWSHTESVKFKNVNSSNINDLFFSSKTVFIGDNCKNISVYDNNTLVNMSGIIKTVNNYIPLYSSKPSGYKLITIDEIDFRKLKLVKFCIGGTWQLIKNVNSLELVKLTFADANMVFKVNHVLNDICVCGCDINIDILCRDQLKRMCLVDSKMLYHPDTFISVKWLSLAELNIYESLKISNSVEHIFLGRIFIMPGKRVIISKNISFLHIINTVGVIDASNTVFKRAIKLKGGEMIRLDRLNNVEYSLQICNIDFVCLSGMLSPKIKKLKLKNITMDSNGTNTYILNCSQVEVSSCNFLIEFSEFNKLPKNSTRNLASTCTNKIIIHSNISILKLENMQFSYSLTLPSFIKSVFLCNVVIVNENKFVINKECEEIQMICCKGAFDLSGIIKPKKVIFVSSPGENNFLNQNMQYLYSISSLGIGGHIENDTSMHMLSQSKNLRKLTLCNIMLVSANTNNLVDNSSNLQQSFLKKVNLCFLQKMICFNLVNKLEHLDISKMTLDYMEINILDKFTKLKTLIVNIDAIGRLSLDDLPNSLETFEIRRYCHYEPSTNTFAKLKSLYFKGLQTHRNIKNLTFHWEFYEKYNFFFFLPKNLEKLEISAFYPSSSRQESEIEKITLKKLVLILETVLDIESIVVKNWSKQYFSNTLNYLQNFINFNKLDMLVLETNDEGIVLNKLTYQIESIYSKL